MHPLNLPTSLRRAVTVAGVTLVIAAAVAVGARSRASAYRPMRPDKGVLTFRHHAAEAAAVSRDNVWHLSVAEGGGMGLIVAAAFCRDEAFLLDHQRALVHRVDLVRGAIAARLGGTSKADQLVNPASIAADCEGRRLYVVDSSGVVVLDADSGAVQRRFAEPRAFSNSVGPAVLDLSASSLYVPGLWPTSERDWRSRPIERMFQGHRVGYRLDLVTGRTSPLVRASDRGCWSLGPNCLYVTLDRVRSGEGGWVAAHRVDWLVGVFDEQLRRVRTIDVRSPMFIENGERNGSKKLEDMVTWNEQNSVIRGVFSFGSRIATVHTFNRTINWKRGGQTDFEVFMNIHTLDGEGLVGDMKLPGLPVGRDDTSLYIVDYGPAGRRAMGREPVTLIKVSVRSE